MRDQFNQFASFNNSTSMPLSKDTGFHFLLFAAKASCRGFFPGIQGAQHDTTRIVEFSTGRPRLKFAPLTAALEEHPSCKSTSVSTTPEKRRQNTVRADSPRVERRTCFRSPVQGFPLGYQTRP